MIENCERYVASVANDNNIKFLKSFNFTLRFSFWNKAMNLHPCYHYCEAVPRHSSALHQWTDC